jgi:hypothetical protein
VIASGGAYAAGGACRTGVSEELEGKAPLALFAFVAEVNA